MFPSNESRCSLALILLMLTAARQLLSLFASESMLSGVVSGF